MAVKIGQIGTQHVHANGKAKALIRDEGVEFIGVFEPDPKLLAEAKANAAWEGVTWLDSADALFKDPSVKAVFIETHPLHNQFWVRQALNAGKHVHCDKAPGTSLAEFRSLVALAKERGLVLQQGYQFRYNKGLRFAVESAKKGLLGRPFHLRARISVDLVDYERLRSEIEPCPGGMFYYLGSHMVDLMTSVFGRPTRVTPTLHGHGDAPNAYIDNTIVVFEFPRATAVIEAATIEVSAFEHRRFEIFGTKGSVIVEPFENPAPKVLLALDSERDGYRKGWQPVEVGHEARYVEDIAELLGLMAGTQTPIVSSEHDITAHETLLRACGVLGG